MKNNATLVNAEAMQAIFELDLESIKRKLMNPEDGLDWTREQADRCEIEYKRFLAMAAIHRELALVPSVEVDQFWHAHILDTRKYAADCERVLGFFLHHAPDTGPREAEDVARQQAAFAQSRALYEEIFGASSDRDMAWCGLAVDNPGEKAAWCGLASRNDGEKAAWCGRAGKSEEKAAWCGRAGKKADEEAAWCGIAAKKGEETAAWCGIAGNPSREKGAWCGIAVEMSAEDAVLQNAEVA